MKNESLTVSVRIDAAVFRKFALFDTFRRQRRWVSPVVFSAIFLCFSAVAFVLRERAEQAVLLGGVLLGIGVFLPAVYFLSFFFSIRAQIRRLGLSSPRPAYTLQLSGDGVAVFTDKEQATYWWADFYGAYRTPHSIYLYAAPNRAYLLPNEQVKEGADTLWNLINTFMPLSRLHDCRIRRQVSVPPQ